MSSPETTPNKREAERITVFVLVYALDENRLDVLLARRATLFSNFLILVKAIFSAHARVSRKPSYVTSRHSSLLRYSFLKIPTQKLSHSAVANFIFFAYHSMSNPHNANFIGSKTWQVKYYGFLLILLTLLESGTSSLINLQFNTFARSC